MENLKLFSRFSNTFSLIILFILSGTLLLANCGKKDDKNPPMDNEDPMAMMDVPVASLGNPTSTNLMEAGGSSTIQVSLSPAPSEEVTVMLTIFPAPQDGDYSITTNANITIGDPIGGGLPVMISIDAISATRTLTITAAADDDDILEVLTVAIMDGGDYTLSGTSSREIKLTIQDDDVRVASLGTPSRTAMIEGEGGASGKANIMVDLNAAALRNIMVVLEITQKDPAETPDGVTYELDYGVTTATSMITFDNANTDILRNRQVMIPFAVGEQTREITITAMEDVDGLSEVLTISIMPSTATDYRITTENTATNAASREFSMTDNEPEIIGIFQSTGGMPNAPIPENFRLAFPVFQIEGDGTFVINTRIRFMLGGTFEAGDIGNSVSVGFDCTSIDNADPGDILEIRIVNNDLPLTRGTPVNLGSDRVEFGLRQIGGFCFICDDDDDNETVIIEFIPGDGYRIPDGGAIYTINVHESSTYCM